MHTIDGQEILTVVWTKKAVAQWDTKRTFEPRHTIDAYPVDRDSPWFRDDMTRKFGSSWVCVDGAGAMVARS